MWLPAVGAVHRHRGAFADGVQAVDNLVLAVFTREHLAVVVGRNAAHLIVDGRNDGDRFLDRVDVAELDGDFADRGQTLVDDVGAQVVQLQDDVAAVRTETAAFLDFLVHRAGHEVTRSQILQRGRIALHEAFAILVQEDAAFATQAFVNKHARAGHAGRVY
ncbi:hypothetical protein G6F31_019753 [Rhizopus arrhizus]|nr:hypothetical protein G6F31_019753 [Rhizopus arrhizus]